MLPEIYRTTLVLATGPLRLTVTTFWALDNASGASAWRNAKAINAAIFLGLGWLFEFSGIISEHLALVRVRTGRVFPTNAAYFTDVIPPGVIVGRLEGRVDTTFDAYWLQFLSDLAPNAKNGWRISPCPVGHVTREGVSFILRARVQTFFEQHAADHVTADGNTFHAVLQEFGEWIRRPVAYQFGRPFSRQIQRRVRG